jgi:hypothetical protein
VVGHRRIDLDLAGAARHIAVHLADPGEGIAAAGPVEVGLQGRTAEHPVERN